MDRKTKITKDKRSQVPSLPGCYLYKNSKGKVLYVGKAKNLKKRVNQYFQYRKDLDPKIQKMLEETSGLETVVTGSEIEALILEANLIKKYRPKYNARLKDDKSYAWIVVTKEPFPRVYSTRRFDTKSKDRWFGPYPESRAIHSTLKFLRTLFPYRTCKHTISKDIKKEKVKKPRRCLYYHMGLCEAPCDGLVKKTDYQKRINNVLLFLRSRKKHLIKSLEKEMNALSKKKDYEEAAIVRDQIEALKTISKRVYVYWGQDEYDIRQTNYQRARRGAAEIIEVLRKHNIHLPKPTENYLKHFKVECYDISNTQGEYATGSMVVFVGGLMKKSLYRRFKIRADGKPDDYKMLGEVFSRRFTIPEKKRQKAGLPKHGQPRDPSFSKLPKLIIVDGGKGQRNAAQKAFDKKKGLPKIPIIGLSKKEEEVWVKNQKNPVRFIKGSDAYFLLQRIRDEAHRFAISYHRKLRRKSIEITNLKKTPRDA